MNNPFTQLSTLTSLIKMRILGTSFPLYAWLCVTYRCNSRCRYCYGDFPQKKIREFTTIELIDIIDQLARLGTKRLQVCGGEALLRDDINVIIDYIKDKGMFCGLATNGFVVPERIQYLQRLDILCISLDGDEDANDLYRGKGSFKKALEALRYARRQGITVRILATLTKEAVYSLEKLIEISREYACYLNFQPLQPQTSQRHLQSAFPTEKEVKKAIKKILEYKYDKKDRINFCEKAFLHYYNWPGYEKPVYLKGEPVPFRAMTCTAGRYSTFIGADGFVYPCPIMLDLGLFKPLNIKTDGPKAAIRHAAAHPCRSCYAPCFSHFNMLFSLHPQALWDTAKLRFRENREKSLIQKRDKDRSRNHTPKRILF
jgi:MoaA/NifB/PqqE/SkfB family radical SAM enzyme